MATQVAFQLESSLASKHLLNADNILGSYLIVTTTAERDALPVFTASSDGIIVKGSLVYVTSEELFYQYDGSAWIEAEFGGGSQAYVVSTTDEPDFASTNQEIIITTDFTDTEGTTHNVEDLKVGETIYVEESTYPNRWVADVYSEEPPVPPGPGRLPEAYQEVEYLQSSGTQYIDSGVTCGTGFKAQFSMNLANVGIQDIIGDTSSIRSFYTIDNNRKHNLGLVNDNTSDVSVSANVWYDMEVCTFSGNGYIKVDNQTVITATNTYSYLNSTIYVMSVNADRWAPEMNGKMKQVKLWDSTNTLVRNLIPCYRKSDSVAGMYDLVNNQFYTNAGTGSFVVGPDANTTSNSNSNSNSNELTYKAKLFRVGKVDPADVTKAYVDAQDTAEATARAAADTTLQTNITNEATTRANADTTLQTNITNEATARQTADTTLQTNITNEATTRAAADTILETNKEDKSNKTTILSSQSTDTQYPSAKVVYDNIEDVREVAEGKTKTYIVSDVTNPSFNSQADTIQISGTFTDTDGIVHNVTDLKKGDNLYVIETDVPDRWSSGIQYIAPASDTNGSSSQPARLPAEYQEVEYLQSTGTQWIDTGIITDVNDNISVKFSFPTFPINERCVCGFWKNTYNYLRISYFSGNTYGCGGITNVMWSPDNICEENKIVSLSGKAQYTITNSLYLFAQHEGVPTHLASCKIYSFSIENKINLVPAYRKTDNVAGMYDLINNVFYTNSGTGTFIVGSDVTDPTPTHPIPIVSTTLKDIDDNSVELRSVGTYKDTYTSSGTLITRNIGVKVLDGTEDWELYTSSTVHHFFEIVINDSNTDNTAPLSNCYSGIVSSTTFADMNNYSFRHGASSTNYYFADDRFTTAEELKTWLAAQYTAGNPVTVYYPLATPTTETKALFIESETGLSILYKLETTKERVMDVQLNGTTCVNPLTRIANIPKAGNDYGVVKTSSIYGVGIASNGILMSQKATNGEIESKGSTIYGNYHQIVPGNLDKAVMEGLGNNSLTWTDQYKSNARTTIGAEASSNKITVLSSASTDTEYPSAKCVYDNTKDQVKFVAQSLTMAQQNQTKTNINIGIIEILEEGDI